MKLTVVGRGMAGLLSASHFQKWSDYEIEVVGDPEISPVTVGEGSLLPFPEALQFNLGFGLKDMFEVGATQKHGIYYEGWGKENFLHPFKLGAYALHFDSSKMRNWIEKRLTNVTFTEDHIDDIETVDADYVMDCRGWENENLRIPLEAPINSAVIVDREHTLDTTTLAKAMKNGWMFGIPLQHRMSYGYLYNDMFATEEEILEEMLEVVGEGSPHRSMWIPSYYTGKQDGGRIIRNGNASHFFEPLEATSLACVDRIARLAYDHWHNPEDQILFGIYYSEMLIDLEALINMHYLNGSVHKTDFWEHASKIAEETMANLPLNRLKTIRSVLKEEDLHPSVEALFSWPVHSVKINFDSIGVTVKDVERWMEKTPNR